MLFLIICLITAAPPGIPVTPKQVEMLERTSSDPTPKNAASNASPNSAPTCNAPDTGAAHLASLPLLENLTLSGNPITDAALPHLLQMRQLRRLNSRAPFLTHTFWFRAIIILPTPFEWAQILHCASFARKDLDAAVSWGKFTDHVNPRTRHQTIPLIYLATHLFQ